jgi:hypothetical protein
MYLIISTFSGSTSNIFNNRIDFIINAIFHIAIYYYIILNLGKKFCKT